MNRVSQTLWCVLCAAVAMGGEVSRAEELDIAAVTAETQQVRQDRDRTTIVWWIPAEFWKASLAQTPGITAEQTEDLLKVLRPYTVVAVLDMRVGPFGGATYQPEDWLRANTRLVDAKGRRYAPKLDEDIDADTQNLLQAIKPVLVNLLGSMGQNMHFFLFPSETPAGDMIASATKKGELKVEIGTKEFTWRLPLDCVLPAKSCASCDRDCKGSWKFCPWCGTALDEKQP
jgi:hypothetical protein